MVCDTVDSCCCFLSLYGSVLGRELAKISCLPWLLYKCNEWKKRNWACSYGDWILFTSLCDGTLLWPSDCGQVCCVVLDSCSDFSDNVCFDKFDCLVLSLSASLTTLRVNVWPTCHSLFHLSSLFVIAHVTIQRLYWCCCCFCCCLFCCSCCCYNCLLLLPWACAEWG